MRRTIFLSSTITICQSRPYPASLLLLIFGVISLLLQPAQAQIAANKSFSPISVISGQTSTVTIDLFNPGSTAATATAFTDTLPSGVVITSPASTTNTCSGTLTATAGASSFSLVAGVIPAAVGATPGACQVTVSVVSNTPNSYTNTLATGSVTSSRGSNGSSASATLTVAVPAPVTGSKSFLPVNIHGDNISTLTITVTNPNAIPLTSATLTDSLPSGMIVAATPAAATTCGTGTVSAVAGSSSVSLSAGTIAANSSCTITVDVKSSVGSTNYSNTTLTNTIAANNITNTQGVTNSAAISRTIQMQTGAQVTKAFAPSSISAGGTSNLTFTLINYNNTAITGASFNDMMPAGVVVTSITANTCGGTASFLSDQAQVTGATIPAAPTAAGSGSCVITATVTAAATGSYVNSVPAGNLGGINYPSTSATLTVNSPSSISLSKVFSPSSIPQTGTSTLTITLNNSSASPASITSFTDNLTTMGAGITIHSTPAAATTCGGTINAASGGTLITKTDGVIPASGSCTITVPIIVSATAATGSRTNTIAVNGVQTSAGNNTVTVTAAVTLTTGATVAKAFSLNPVPAGGISRLTITLSHRSGAVAFTGMGISDTLPAGHTINTTPNLASTCGGAVTAPAGGSTITLTGGALATGTTSCTIAVDIRVPAGAGSATNTIPVNALVTDQGVTYATAATAALTRVTTSLIVNKSFSPTSVAPGGTSRLSVVLANNNGTPVNLTGVALTDNFPSGLKVQSPANATFTGAGCSGATITATPGASSVSISGASITTSSICTLAVDVTTTFTGTLTNNIPVNTATTAQTVTNNNSPSASLTLLGSADVRVTKSNGATTVRAGGTTVYTIVVTNAGPDNVAGVSVVDTAPTGMTFTSWTCTPSAGSNCTDPSGTGNINSSITLLNTGTATYTVNAAIASAATGSAVNTVTVTEPSTVNDPDRTNNSATDTDTILPSPDLTISKTHTGNFHQGQTGTYTVTVSNIGTAASSGTVTVLDTLPTDLTPTSAIGTGWSCSIVGQLVTCTRTDAVAVSSNYPTITITVSVSLSAAASVTNTANISGGNEPSGHLSNNSSSDPTIIDPAVPTVTGYKSVKLVTDADSNGVISAGDTVRWTIQYVNTGDDSSINFQIADQLPTGVTITGTGNQTVTATGTGTTATKNTSYTGAAAGSLSDLLAAGAVIGIGGVIQIDIPVIINSGVSGNLGNQSSATGSEVVTAVLTDNVDSTTIGLPAGVTVPTGSETQTQTPAIAPTILTVIGIPNVTLVKAVLPAGNQPPETDLTYNIIFTNVGSGAAQKLVITDPVPPSTDFKIGSVAANTGTTGLTFVIEYSNDGAATWSYTPASGGGGATAGYDRNVTHVRWRVTAGTLSPSSPANTGSGSFVVKIQ